MAQETKHQSIHSITELALAPSYRRLLILNRDIIRSHSFGNDKSLLCDLSLANILR
jgi:hypothetical protein